MLMAMTAWPCCTPMLLTCPTGTPAMLTVSPPARPVTSVSSALTVWRLLKSEMLPILHGQADQQHDADEREDRELERRGREVPPEPHDDGPPSSWLRIAAERGRLGRVGLADDAVDLVRRRRRPRCSPPTSARSPFDGVDDGGRWTSSACSEAKVDSWDAQLKAEPAPASACWSGSRYDIPPVGRGDEVADRLLTSLKRMNVLK